MRDHPGELWPHLSIAAELEHVKKTHGTAILVLGSEELGRSEPAGNLTRLHALPRPLKRIVTNMDQAMKRSMDTGNGY